VTTADDEIARQREEAERAAEQAESAQETAESSARQAQEAADSAEDSVDTASVGWPAGSGAATAQLVIEKPALAFGRFRVRLGLVSTEGRTLHSFDDAISFLVYPDGEWQPSRRR